MEEITFDIDLLGGRRIMNTVDLEDIVSKLPRYGIWPMEQAYAEMRFNMLSHLIRQGKTPVSPLELRLTIEMEQRCVSDRLLAYTDGKLIEVEPSQARLRVYQRSMMGDSLMDEYARRVPHVS